MKKAAWYVLSITLVAAIGGLIFGFDTAIVAGATRYMKEQFSLNSLQEGWAVSVVLIGCMFGAGLAGTISDRIGRRRFMLVSAVLFLISAVGCALPRTITEFVIFRFIGGLGIGYGGLDHVLAMNRNVNVLVLDTEVYSNTGGQASKSTPVGSVAKFASSGKRTSKKDLGRMAMSYGYVYVASVAMGANMNQCLKAFLEAESFPGPSIIIAYSPCINHGIDMSKSQAEEKLAVDTGYWTLYRFNPLLAKEGKNPFQLDSREPKLEYDAFLKNEVRYKTLVQQFPEIAKELFARAAVESRKRYEAYKKMAE